MAYIQQQKIDSILSYLNILKDKTNDNDTILSINEIKEDLIENTISSKSDILDELNSLIILTSSLREQMFVLSNNKKRILVNTEIYTYAIYSNLEYLQNQLCEILSSMENFAIQRKTALK